MSKTLVFFGNEKLATGIPQPEPLILNALENAGWQIEQHLTGPLSELKPHKSEIAVLAAYGRILPQRMIDEFPLGIINVHPSLLPVYRGPTPIEQAILDGATKTGVSIMKITAGMDEGPIFKQKSIKLTGQETKAELAQRLQELGASLLVEILPAIANSSLKPRSQPHPERDASYSKLIRKSDGAMDWNKTAERLEREIRAYAGWPTSYTKLNGLRVIITRAHNAKDGDPDKKPGDIEIIDGLIRVKCADGYLYIERLKPAGKREMSAKEWLAGNPLKS